jgi:hypothetical protein
MSVLSTTSPALAGIDPRGPRVAAALTSAVLALALVTPRAASIVLVALQTAVFAVGAFRGVQHTPYAALFRTTLRPRLAAATELEDPRPPRFAQALGLAFAGVGLVALLAGAVTLGLVAIGLALVAALLNAVFGLCLGCELYLIIRRATAR